MTYTNEYHELAKKKGFHDDEEWKDGKPTPRQLLAWSALVCTEFLEWQEADYPWVIRESGKPCGSLSELADIWIRCQDLGGALGVELREATEEESCQLEWKALCKRLMDHDARKCDVDAFLRTLGDMCGFARDQARLEIKGWDDERIPATFEETVRIKHEFNKTRPFRHGKKA